MILRLLGVVYAVAFLAAANQVIPLIGAKGLLPVGDFLQQVDANFFRLPSIFWWTHTDTALLVAAWGGFALSCAVALGYANIPMMAVLWFLYMSFVNVGQDWYGYGWEIQLMETGFLAIFLCPLTDPRPFPNRPPPFPIIGLFRWLIVRIMLGSGLIKLRGDVTWRNGTALYYHFETQPIPGPLSRWFHFLPRRLLKLGVWYNFFAELAAPFFAFWPRIGRHIAGVVMILLQVILIMSGNLSFLNWLTIIPALACFDDGFWARVLPRALVRRAEAARASGRQPTRTMTITAWTVTGIVAMLSIMPVTNMLSPHQIMTTSYDPLALVNTYGAFGSVGQERYNVVYEGSMDSIDWKEYRYKYLPVDTDQRPLQVAPYQPRLDWQMWFAAMSTPDQYLWTVNLVYKLLQGQPDIVGLFAANPFPGAPPHYIRAVLYKYSFARPGSGHWWRRERLGNWLPVLSLDYFSKMPTVR